MAVILLFTVPNTHAVNLSTWNGSFSSYWDDEENWVPMYAPLTYPDIAVIGATFYRPDIYLRYTPNGGQFHILKEFSYQSPYTPQTFHVNDGLSLVMYSVTNATGQPLYFDFTNGEIDLYGSAGKFTNYSSSQGGVITFTPGIQRNGDAGSSVIHCGCEGDDAFQCVIYFGGPVTANKSTLIADGCPEGAGSDIIFDEQSLGGTARVELFGNGQLDISPHRAPLTIGSVEGDGLIFLGDSQLTVGSNSLSTAFSGIIQDGGDSGGAGGSLGKTGSGTLTLSGASTYTGITTVSAGTLLVNNTTGSGTGTNTVMVSGGTLGGTGIISNAVAIGNGSGTTAFLAPGSGGIGTFTIQKKLTFKADAVYECEIDSGTATFDRVTAKGVKIQGANFALIDLGTGTLTPGTVFTVIDNTAANAILGQFANLADGSTQTIGNNTYLVSYSGGSGNDLTLTVVQ
jgi:autotransporter-associated beta strand protein